MTMSPTRHWLLERQPVSPGFDLTGDVERQIDTADGERRLGRERAGVELAARGRLAHRLLDLALRRDADLLEELAHAHVEGVFVHVVLQILAGCERRLGIRRAPAFTIADQRE